MYQNLPSFEKGLIEMHERTKQGRFVRIGWFKVHALNPLSIKSFSFPVQKTKKLSITFLWELFYLYPLF